MSLPPSDCNHCEPEPTDGVSTASSVWLLALLLAVATFGAHFPAVLAGYTWDDDRYLYQSPLTTAPDGLYRVWFTTEATDYYPLTRTTFWLEWRIWGNHPMPYHVVNILLHSVAGVLLWRVLRRLNVSEPAAYLAGLIFAIHPVTVESVAWISERKNVLSIGLYLLAILAYLRFEDDGDRRWHRYALVAAAAALLAKTSVAMLPVVLLLCAWWRRGRLTRRDILNTLPFFALSLALGLLGMWFEHHKSISGVIVRPEGLASRIAASGWIVWFHLYKIFLPINLAMVYPRWDVDGGRVISFVPLGLLIACFAVLWYYRKSWARGPLAAAAYFVLAMGPLLGFVDVAFMKHSLVADHFQYAAMPAVIALVSGLLAYPLTRTGARRSSVTWAAGAAVICAVVLTLGTLTWRQAQLYRDEESLWTHTIALNNRAWVAYNNRGIAYAKRGLGDRALQDYDKAIALEPDRAQSWNNRGNACREMGDFSQAIHDYTKAIELEPDSAGAYYNRANAYNTRGDYREAISDHTKAIELRPDFMDAYNNRAIAHFYLKEYEKAWADVRVVKRLGGQPTPDLISALTEATGRTE